MSRENMEIVRGGFEAFARGDFDSMLAQMHPNVEWLTVDDFIDPGPYRGHDGVRRLIGVFTDIFDDYTFEAEGFRDYGEKVIVLVRQWGRGRESGIEIDLRFVLVFTVQGGKTLRVESYYDEEQAIEAVGRRE